MCKPDYVDNTYLTATLPITLKRFVAYMSFTKNLLASNVVKIKNIKKCLKIQGGPN